MDLNEAIAMVKAAGYRVTKPAEKKLKTVGPTFVGHWQDGVVTRMSIAKGLGFAKLSTGHFERAGYVLHAYQQAELAQYL